MKFAIVDSNNLYSILQIASNADLKSVKQAYKMLAKKYHPDVSNLSDAVVKFQELKFAYDVLSDPVKRLKYDYRQLKKKKGIENQTIDTTFANSSSLMDIHSCLRIYMDNYGTFSDKWMMIFYFYWLKVKWRYIYISCYVVGLIASLITFYDKYSLLRKLLFEGIDEYVYQDFNPLLAFIMSILSAIVIMITFAFLVGIVLMCTLIFYSYFKANKLTSNEAG